MTSFVDDDPGYLAWVAGHPEGYVVNCFRVPTANYLILHRATCRSINTPRRGNWTTAGYVKICGMEVEELRRWAGDKVGGSLQPCGLCKPPIKEVPPTWWTRLREWLASFGRVGVAWPRVKTAIEFTAALFAVLGGIAAFLQWLL